MENKELITGFRKLHGTQHSMVTMLENGEKRIYLHLIYGSINGLMIQSITIFCWKSWMHMVSL